MKTNYTNSFRNLPSFVSKRKGSFSNFYYVINFLFILTILMVGCESNELLTDPSVSDAESNSTLKTTEGAIPGFPSRIAFGERFLMPSWNANGTIPFDIREDSHLDQTTQNDVIHLVYFWQLVRYAGPNSTSATLENIQYALNNNPSGLYDYFEEYKERLLEYSVTSKPVAFILDPDQMNIMGKHIVNDLNGDATLFSAKLQRTGHPDVLEAGVPDNFAGYCQVLAYMRDKYAPGIMLGPVAKIHEGAIENDKYSAAQYSDAEREQEISDFVQAWSSCGITWDALFVNWANFTLTLKDNGSFENIVKLHGGIAQGLGTRAINWRIEINTRDLETGSKELINYKNNAVHFVMRDPQFMWDNGFQGVVFKFKSSGNKPMDLGKLGEALRNYYNNLPDPGNSYNLTVGISGSGTVTPAGGTYTEGTDVTLTATPDVGFEFSGWSGDLSGTANPISITMNSNKNVTATFTEIQVPVYSLTTNVVGDGTISLNPVGGSYAENTVVTITAIPAAGWIFESWSGDASGTNSSASITMNSNKSVTASFIPGGSGTEVILGATDDSFILDNSVNENKGADRSISIKNVTKKVGLVKFDLTGVSGQVISAKLELTSSNNSSGGNVSVYSVSGDNWNESTVTYSNAPAQGSLLGSSSLGGSGTVYNIDVSSFVITESNGDKVVSLWLNDNLSNGDRFDFYSKEASGDTGPKLILEVN